MVSTVVCMCVCVCHRDHEGETVVYQWIECARDYIASVLGNLMAILLIFSLPCMYNFQYMTLYLYIHDY